MATAQEYISGLLRKNQSGGMNKYSPTQNMTSVKTGKPAVGSITSAPSASPIKSAAITPPQTQSSSLSSPAAQTFVQNQDSYFQNLANRNPAQADREMDTAGYTNSPNKNGAAVSKPAESEYLKYMRSIFNPQELDRAQKQKESYNTQVLEASKRLGEIRTNQLGTGLEGREAQEARLDLPGGTTAGATQAANMIGRRTNAELARLGVQEAGAAASLNALTGAQANATEIYNAMLDAGATVYEAEQAALKSEEGFTLGKDQTRYDAQGNVIAGGGSSSTGGGIYTPGADPVADAYVKLFQEGKLKIENVPEEYRGAVAQGGANAPAGDDPKAKYVRSQADEALTNIDTALGFLDNQAPDFKLSESAIGRAIGGLVPGSQTADLNAALTTLKALVGFDALQKMRESSPTGGALGQITERELAFLQSVQGSLNTSQSTAQLTATIQRIQKSFLTLKLVNSPDGTVFNLDGEEYVKQGDQLVPAGDFSSAGNASASNLPQRNNNPGNVKAGGLADSLAVGTDAQGHLIFPNAQAGFQALQMDLQAKIAGRSKYLPPNPTIAQLGSVYAEDANWPKSVARILGVSPNTPTGQLDFNQLMQAIATQEGFYA